MINWGEPGRRASEADSVTPFGDGRAHYPVAGRRPEPLEDRPLAFTDSMPWGEMSNLPVPPAGYTWSPSPLTVVARNEEPRGPGRWREVNGGALLGCGCLVLVWPLTLVAGVVLGAVAL